MAIPSNGPITRKTVFVGAGSEAKLATIIRGPGDGFVLRNALADYSNIYIRAGNDIIKVDREGNATSLRESEERRAVVVGSIDLDQNLRIGKSFAFKDSEGTEIIATSLYEMVAILSNTQIEKSVAGGSEVVSRFEREIEVIKSKEGSAKRTRGF